MKHDDWERILLDPDELARVLEWSRNARDPGVQVVEESLGFTAEPPLHHEPLTAALLQSNDRSTDAAPSFHEVARFLPDAADLSPLEALAALQTRYREEMSNENAVLLQSAMNRLTSAGQLQESERSAVDGAALLLSEPDTTNQPPRGDNIWYTLHEHPDFQGMASFDSMTSGWGYWRRPSFVSMGMNDIFSSLSYGASAEELGGAVLLFEHERYFGAYRTFIPTPGRTTYVNYIGNDFNDKTSSALIVRRFARETPPVTLGSLVPKSSITDIINDTPRVRPDGDPVFTWDMWPAGGTSGDWHPNDVASIFIYVIVPIMVHTPWPYADYHAQARYWIRLLVDSNGRLQGSVAYWGYWVESGIISGQVGSGLADAIPGTIPQVNSLIARAVGLANVGGPFSYVYYLPGRFQLAGNVSDDVTIVAVRR